MGHGQQTRSFLTVMSPNSIFHSAHSCISTPTPKMLLLEHHRTSASPKQSYDSQHLTYHVTNIYTAQIFPHITSIFHRNTIIRCARIRHSPFINTGEIDFNLSSVLLNRIMRGVSTRGPSTGREIPLSTPQDREASNWLASSPLTPYCCVITSSWRARAQRSRGGKPEAWPDLTTRKMPADAAGTL